MFSRIVHYSNQNDELKHRVNTTCQQFRETVKIMGNNEIEQSVTKLVSTYMQTLCV